MKTTGSFVGLATMEIQFRNAHPSGNQYLLRQTSLSPLREPTLQTAPLLPNTTPRPRRRTRRLPPPFPLPCPTSVFHPTHLKRTRHSRNNHRLRHHRRQCFHHNHRHNPPRRRHSNHPRPSYILTHHPRRRRPASLAQAPQTPPHPSGSTYTLTVSVAATPLLSIPPPSRTRVSHPRSPSASASLFPLVLVAAGSLTHVTNVGSGPPVVSAGGTPPRQSDVIHCGGLPAPPRFSRHVEPESVK